MLPIKYLHEAGGNRWGNPVESACLYYPGAYTDTGPLDLILRSRSATGQAPFDSLATAIYVDINITPDVIEQLIDRVKRLYSTNVVLVNDLLPADFGAFQYSDFFPNPNDSFYASTPDYAQEYALENQNFFGLRAFFPEIQFHLIYLRAEGIQAYRALQKAKVYPNIVVLQDHGPWGFQFATFYGDCLLYKAAKKLPRYLYLATEGESWPGYERVTDGYCDEGQEHRYERYLAAGKSVVARLNRRAE
ncbi:hypothetical protein ICN30_07910 [Polynucleobacter sp. 31A-FELB]|jgi:hypothetical protein|uniref:hypothetical protein n=1 Tax=Polynucleobacter sp. 31A-FELB TaxID=2689096 RepID=UPI001C0D6AB8|nr:hypothetical protein [Polynucleobacter sp. 31A-FELB]MBU3587756.1 hypothetical protein [Polynucleobacter sp. 31A-FELB]